MEGDVYNGGFHQYFFNDAGSYYAYAEEGLITIGALQTLVLLQEAKELLFASGSVPLRIGERRKVLPYYSKSDSETPMWSAKLDVLNNRYWQDSEGISLRMRAFARDNQLVADAG